MSRRWVFVGCVMVLCAVAVALVWLITHQSSDQQALMRGVWYGPGFPSECGFDMDKRNLGVTFDERQMVEETMGDLGCSGRYRLDATHEPPLLIIEFSSISTTYRYRLIAEHNLTLFEQDGTVLTYTWQAQGSCGLC